MVFYWALETPELLYVWILEQKFGWRVGPTKILEGTYAQKEHCFKLSFMSMWNGFVGRLAEMGVTLL